MPPREPLAQDRKNKKQRVCYAMIISLECSLRCVEYALLRFYCRHKDGGMYGGSYTFMPALINSNCAFGIVGCQTE